MYRKKQKAVGSKQVGDYVFKADPLDKKVFLGGGAFGKVYLGNYIKKKTDNEVAVKVIPMSSLGGGGTAKIEIDLFR